MFSKDSRYASLSERKFEPEDGGPEIRYVSRRLVSGSSIRGEVRTQGPLRLDLLANREIGKSEYFWRICDVNTLELNPFALELLGGAKLKIPDV